MFDVRRTLSIGRFCSLVSMFRELEQPMLRMSADDHSRRSRVRRVRDREQSTRKAACHLVPVERPRSLTDRPAVQTVGGPASVSGIPTTNCPQERYHDAHSFPSPLTRLHTPRPSHIHTRILWRATQHQDCMLDSHFNEDSRSKKSVRKRTLLFAVSRSVTSTLHLLLL